MSWAIKHLPCAQLGGSHRQMTSHVILPVGTLTPNHGQGNRVWGWGLSRCPGTQGPWDLPGSCCIWEAHPIRPRLQDPWEQRESWWERLPESRRLMPARWSWAGLPSSPVCGVGGSADPSRYLRRAANPTTAPGPGRQGSPALC